MEQFTDVQAVELFYLAFLLALPGRLDRSHYVVKGGVNLRYFFDSPRYSQDIDLDAVDVEPWHLEAKVDEVLASPAMVYLLGSDGLTLEQITKPKPTATTQRWMLSNESSDCRLPVHTKIEFSHRAADRRRILEAVPDGIATPLGAARSTRPFWMWPLTVFSSSRSKRFGTRFCGFLTVRR